MKVTAFFASVLIFLLFITSGPSYFKMLTSEAEQSVFAYTSIEQENIQMKPISRGDSLDRKKHEAEIKLMTYNMHRGIGKDGKLDLNAVAEVIDNSDAAVVALQEVERHSIRTGFQDQIALLAEKIGMKYAYGKSFNILNWEYGNGLLSKHPIEEYKVFDLPSFSEQRTVLRTVIDVEGIKIAIYNTHLGLKEAERKEQLDFILQMTSEEKLDYILMGDLNSRSSKLKKITETMKDSAQVMGKENMSTFVEESVQARIDYIFVSQDIEVMNYDVLISEASDHYPVVSDVVIKK